MATLPDGTVTFLFTDVHGSTELIKQLQEDYARALDQHRAALRTAFAEHDGVEVDTQGDAFFVVFARARDAVASAAAAQKKLANKPWPRGISLSVRMGLHSGEAFRAEHGYTGLAVHRAARICTIAHGGQVLLSRSTAGIISDQVVPAVTVRDLGDHTLKDFPEPERIFQLVIEGLPADFPPLRSIDQQVPLQGTATVVMVEGRRMMRLYRELSREAFGSLLADYRRLLGELLARAGGSYVEAAGDTVLAAFPTAKDAAKAAADVVSAVDDHEWIDGLRVAVSVGLHSGTAGVGWVGPAIVRCEQMCDAAEGGEIFMSPTTAGLLEDEDLEGLSVRDLGERPTRRSQERVRAYELLLRRS